MALHPRVTHLWFCGVLATLLGACTAQYDPTPTRNLLERERKVADRDLPKLTEKGELPAAGGPVVSIDQRFATLCSTCHGPTGHGDGPAGQALNPKPRNFHDGAWQAKVDDERIYKVIKEGGASVGLSSIMAPWGAVLSDEEIKGLVFKIRKFKDQ